MLEASNDAYCRLRTNWCPACGIQRVIVKHSRYPSPRCCSLRRNGSYRSSDIRLLVFHAQVLQHPRVAVQQHKGSVGCHSRPGPLCCSSSGLYLVYISLSLSFPFPPFMSVFLPWPDCSDLGTKELRNTVGKLFQLSERYLQAYRFHFTTTTAAATCNL
jgi:hypothetical protein